MNPRNLFLMVASVIVMGSFTLMGQGLIDGVKVTLPYPVTIDDVVLEPGEYEIRRPSTTNDQMLRFFSNDKLRYQTVALTVPATDKEPPEESKVILHHIGDKYYFDKIWIEGKAFGYEFPLPERARALQRELAVNVPATNQSAPEASSAPPQQGEGQDRNDSLNLEVPSRDTPVESSSNSNVDAQPQEIAALQGEQQNPRAPAVDSRQDSAQSSVQTNQSDARALDSRQANDELPATASGWVAYLLSGGLLIIMAGLWRVARGQEG